jgi:Starch-binding associating with outer membrane
MKLKNIAAVLLLAGSLASCKKEWLDVNTNPNALPTSTPDFLFTNGLVRMTGGNGILLSNELGSYWSGQWTQSASYIISGPQFQYNFTNGDFNYWDGWYDVLSDFNYAQQKAGETGLDEFKGASRVMKAYIFQQIVDCYGNAPYSQALKGSDLLTPAFDDQKSIYEGLIKDLDSAIVELKANPFAGATSSADVAFKGNNTRWIQFANSLKLRILMRQSRVAGRDAYIIAEINKAVADGFLPAGVDVGVNPGWLATDTKTNPYYDRWGYSPAGAQRALGRFPRPTKFLFDNMVAMTDTFRMKRIAYANGGENGNNPGVSTLPEIIANYKGVPFGESAGQFTAPATSWIGPSVLVKGEYNRQFYFILNTEVQFMLAEAKQRYGSAVNLTGTAQEYFEAGVRESFRITGTTTKYPGAATALLTSGKDLADWTASPDKLKAIWMQKWLALTNFSGLEAWCEYRKNNFPNTPQSAQVPDNRRPLRLFYPGTELGSNRANVEAQGNIDVFTNRLFWDVD